MSSLLTWWPDFVGVYPSMGLAIAIAIFVIVPATTLFLGVRYRRNPKH